MVKPDLKARIFRAAAILRKHKISQAELADIVGASQPQVSRILNAKGLRATKLCEEICLYAERLAGGVSADDAPDIIASTPSGRLVVVECTTKIADFNSKVGKLVDRKNNLQKELQGSRSANRVDGMLVCRLPKTQIATNVSELKAHQIILLTEEDLKLAIGQLREHVDLEKYLDDALAQINIQIPNMTSV